VLFSPVVITLDEILVDESVLTAQFSCDLARCKGACCTLPGGAGAPLLDEEVELVKGAVQAATPYLSERSKKHIEQHGSVEGAAGSWATACIDDRDCVFVTYEGDVATCSIEKAWHAGTSTFRKPLSCHLFPVRLKNFGGPYLHYEQFAECAPGRRKGANDGTLLVDTVKDALVRAFGSDAAERIADAAHGKEDSR